MAEHAPQGDENYSDGEHTASVHVGLRDELRPLPDGEETRSSSPPHAVPVNEFAAPEAPTMYFAELLEKRPKLQLPSRPVKYDSVQQYHQDLDEIIGKPMTARINYFTVGRSYDKIGKVWCFVTLGIAWLINKIRPARKHIEKNEVLLRSQVQIRSSSDEVPMDSKDDDFAWKLAAPKDREQPGQRLHCCQRMKPGVGGELAKKKDCVFTTSSFPSLLDMTMRISIFEKDKKTNVEMEALANDVEDYASYISSFFPSYGTMIEGLKPYISKAATVINSFQADDEIINEELNFCVNQNLSSLEELTRKQTVPRYGHYIFFSRKELNERGGAFDWKSLHLESDTAQVVDGEGRTLEKLSYVVVTLQPNTDEAVIRAMRKNYKMGELQETWEKSIVADSSSPPSSG